MAAGVAVDADESVGEYAAREIRPDLAFHEAGDGRSLRSRSGEDGDELRTDDRLEEGLVGFVANVVGDGWASAGTASTGRGERSRECPVIGLRATRVRRSMLSTDLRFSWPSDWSGWTNASNDSDSGQRPIVASSRWRHPRLVILRNGSVRERRLPEVPETQQHGQHPFELSAELDFVGAESIQFVWVEGLAERLLANQGAIGRCLRETFVPRRRSVSRTTAAPACVSGSGNSRISIVSRAVISAARIERAPFGANRCPSLSRSRRRGAADAA